MSTLLSCWIGPGCLGRRTGRSAVSGADLIASAGRNDIGLVVLNVVHVDHLRELRPRVGGVEDLESDLSRGGSAD
jgi:hypothetical protein